MRILRSARWSLVAVLPALLGGACAPAPIDDPLGWNGRGMSLPVVTGTGGNTGGAGIATDGSRTGAGGTSAGSGTGAGGAAGAGGTGTDASASGGSTATGGVSGAGGGGNGGGGSSPVGADAGLPVGSTCHVAVSVTTHSGGGRYSPENVEAIWVQDAAGKFVKSLYVMGSRRLQHLNAWSAATTAAGLSGNRVDAVTGASLSGYGTRMASWNCTDVNHKSVTSGGYQVCFDLNDDNGADKNTCDSLMIGNTATTIKPPDAQPCFTGRVLTYTP
jgi:hypothetical protein